MLVEAEAFPDTTDGVVLCIVQVPLRELLDARMSELALTQQAAAAQLGVSQSQVSRWRKGVGVSDANARALAKFLGISPAEVQAASYASRERAEMGDVTQDLQELRALLDETASEVASLRGELSDLRRLVDERVRLSEKRNLDLPARLAAVAEQLRSSPR